MTPRDRPRIKAKRMRPCGSGHLARAHITVLIERGGPQWVPYGELPTERRKEWDAFEQIVARLSDRKHLYVSGSFRHMGESSEERFVIKAHQEDWTGMCRVASAEQLHALLVANPDTVGYGYLATSRSLEQDEAFGIAKRHHGAWRAHDMDDCIIEDCPAAFWGIEECIDRNWFGLECRLEDYGRITRTIADVLAEFGLT